MITNKQSNIITDFDSAQDSIQEVYDELNKIINVLNDANVRINKLSDTGSVGEIRVVLDPQKNSKGQNQYKIEAKTDDGWKQTAILTDKVK